jgi:hypothetical protein
VPIEYPGLRVTGRTGGEDLDTLAAVREEKLQRRLGLRTRAEVREPGTLRLKCD